MKNAETADISLAEEKEPDMAGLELLEDEDVLEQSDYNSISHGYALVDKYDASDILRASEEIVSENARETGTGSELHSGGLYVPAGHHQGFHAV